MMVPRCCARRLDDGCFLDCRVEMAFVTAASPKSPLSLETVCRMVLLPRSL